MKKLIILLIVCIANSSIGGTLNIASAKIPYTNNKQLMTFIGSRNAKDLEVNIYYIWLPAGEVKQISSFDRLITTLHTSGEFKIFSSKETEQSNKLVKKKVGEIIFKELIKPALRNVKSTDFLTEIKYNINVKVKVKAKLTTLFILPLQKYLLIRCGTRINNQFIESFAMSYPLNELRLITKTKPMLSSE